MKNKKAVLLHTYENVRPMSNTNLGFVGSLPGYIRVAVPGGWLYQTESMTTFVRDSSIIVLDTQTEVDEYAHKSGPNSWDEYRPAITADEVAENIRRASKGMPKAADLSWPVASRSNGDLDSMTLCFPSQLIFERCIENALNKSEIIFTSDRVLQKIMRCVADALVNFSGDHK